jgi:TetR/AcrR family transcriptional repressor of nem operon
MNEVQPSAKDKLLDAALSVIRRKGYSATTVDDLCRAAHVTKGAFFHHFKSKEELATAAADHWSAVTGRFFASAEFHRLADPRDRVLGYVACRKQLLHGELAEFTCLVGTMVQETYETAPPIREACERSITQHAATLESDIREAMRLYRVDSGWTAQSLALYTQSVIQGAFVLAKATQRRDVAVDCIDHLYRYVESLFKERSP